MGYPKYAADAGSMCMRVAKLKPMTVIKHGDPKVVKVLISEINPPICALIKELSHGGASQSIPLSFASTNTMARTCPPVPCPCKAIVELSPYQKFLKYLILAAKISFLGGTLFTMWYIGVLGPTWDTWNLKECVINIWYACRGIEYRYKDKCKPVPEKDKGPLCTSTETLWNRAVIFYIFALESIFYGIAGKAKSLLDYENCEYEKPPKKEKPPPKGAKGEEEPKTDFRKIYLSIFNEMDPANIACSDPPDYYAQLTELMRGNDD